MTTAKTVVDNDVSELVTDPIESEGTVTLQTLINNVVTAYANGWTLKKCCTVIETSEVIDCAMVGESPLPNINIAGSTDMACHIRYKAAVAVVESVLEQYDDPELNHGLRYSTL